MTYNTVKTMTVFFSIIFLSIQVNGQTETSLFEEYGLEFEKETKEYLYAAPNPFSDVTYLCFSATDNMQYHLVIRNKMGQTVISKNGEVVKGDNRIEIFRSGLPADKYFYRLKIGNRILKNGRLYIVD